MKKIILPFLVIALAAIVVACGSKSKLISEISGSWTGNPERIGIAGQYDADMVSTYEFLPEGQAIISAMVSVDKSMPASDDVVVPVSLNAAATVSVTGTYEVVSEDEVRITPDMNTLTVNVDPSAVTAEYNKLSGGDQPDLVTITPEYAKQIKSELTAAMQKYIPEASNISSIKIDGSNMNASINSNAVELHKN